MSVLRRDIDSPVLGVREASTNEGLGRSKEMIPVGSSWRDMRADKPPMCCVSSQPESMQPSWTMEQLGLLLKAPHRRDRPRLSVPPVVELCVVPTALIAAHSGQAVLGNNLTRLDATTSTELAGACFGPAPLSCNDSS